MHYESGVQPCECASAQRRMYRQQREEVGEFGDVQYHLHGRTRDAAVDRNSGVQLERDGDRMEHSAQRGYRGEADDHRK